MSTNLNDFEIKDGVLIKYTGNEENVVIPKGVTRIGRKAFEGCISIVNIVIPNSVITIGMWAFNGCKGITSIVIPDSVKEIRKYAFYNCISLTEITIPDSVTSIDSEAFKNCTSLKTVTIGNKVETIDSEAFKNCTSLINIVLSDSLSMIGESAFEDCKKLKKVIIPNSVSYIGKCAFKGCTLLSDVEFLNKSIKIDKDAFKDTKYFNSNVYPGGFVIFDGVLVKYIGKDKDIIIPDCVKIIGYKALSQSKGIKSIKIPNSVIEIGDNAFYGCDNLSSLKIPASVKKIGKTPFLYNYEEIFDEAGFEYGTTHIEISRIDVDKNNKYYCSLDGNLYDKSKTKLIQYAVGKKDIAFTVPSGVVSIEDGAFYGASYLKRVIIPEGVTTIKAYAFCFCTLEIVMLPNSLSTIETKAFEVSYNYIKEERSDCDFYYSGTKSEWGNILLTGSNNYLNYSGVYFRPKSKANERKKDDVINEVLFKVKDLAYNRKTEKEILFKLEAENTSIADIMDAMFKVLCNTTVVKIYCDAEIIPKINELFKTKNDLSNYTVGEVLRKLYKEYPKVLVNQSMIRVLSEEYLAD